MQGGSEGSVEEPCADVVTKRRNRKAEAAVAAAIAVLVSGNRRDKICKLASRIHKPFSN